MTSKRPFFDLSLKPFLRDLAEQGGLSKTEIKRHRQGLRRGELSSSDVLDVTVFNLGNLARQSIQRQAEPRMLRLIMSQTSHIMMLVEGTSLSVNQWDQKLRDANWTLRSSDDHHHWVGVRTASSGTSVTKLVDNCGSQHQKIWYVVFDVKLGYTPNRNQVFIMPLLAQLAVPSESTLPICWFCVPTSKLTLWEAQCLQLPVLREWEPADCSFSAGFVVSRDVATLR